MSSSRTARKARLMVAADREARGRFIHEPPPEHAAAYTLDRHIAQARQEMGPDRWAQLNLEWDQSDG